MLVYRIEQVTSTYEYNKRILFHALYFTWLIWIYMKFGCWKISIKIMASGPFFAKEMLPNLIIQKVINQDEKMQVEHVVGVNGQNEVCTVTYVTRFFHLFFTFNYYRNYFAM